MDPHQILFWGLNVRMALTHGECEGRTVSSHHGPAWPPTSAKVFCLKLRGGQGSRAQSSSQLQTKLCSEPAPPWLACTPALPLA